MAWPAVLQAVRCVCCVLQNMATAVTGFFGWLKHQRSDSPENWQHFRLHPQCS